MAQWIDIKQNPLNSDNDEGWYVVLVGRKAHVVYFAFRNWQRDWHIPDEWSDPTHYIRLEGISDDFWVNKKSSITMD